MTRCRQHAESKGYTVAAVFPDTFTGGGDFMKRPDMVALLLFLDAQPDERFVVIFDDLKRYARDTEFHLRLRREMEVRGARRECLNFKFEDTPEGEFVETIMAAQGQLERKQNGRQVAQKMKARMENGYWIHNSAVIHAYEEKLGSISRDQARLRENMEDQSVPAGSFEETLEPALTFLTNPWKIWENGHTTMRQLVLKLVFADRTTYYRNEGLRTAEIALPFKALRALSTQGGFCGAGGGT